MKLVRRVLLLAALTVIGVVTPGVGGHEAVAHAGDWACVSARSVDLGVCVTNPFP